MIGRRCEATVDLSEHATQEMGWQNAAKDGAVYEVTVAHHLAIVHGVGLHSIYGSRSDGRCRHDIQLHIIGIMEVMPCIL